jgi:hypothetical protein
MSQDGRYRCRYCGDRFNLNRIDQELYEDGFFEHEPDECDFCQTHNLPDNDPDRIEDFSDADPGL